MSLLIIINAAQNFSCGECTISFGNIFIIVLNVKENTRHRKITILPVYIEKPRRLLSDKIKLCCACDTETIEGHWIHSVGILYVYLIDFKVIFEHL